MGAEQPHYERFRLRIRLLQGGPAAPEEPADKGKVYGEAKKSQLGQNPDGGVVNDQRMIAGGIAAQIELTKPDSEDRMRDEHGDRLANLFDALHGGIVAGDQLLV